MINTLELQEDKKKITVKEPESEVADRDLEGTHKIDISEANLNNETQMS